MVIPKTRQKSHEGNILEVFTYIPILHVSGEWRLSWVGYLL